MSYDRTPTLLVSIKAADEKREAWAWAIHRIPDQMLILRSRPDYRDPDRALEAGKVAAKGIGRRLDLPVSIERYERTAIDAALA